MSHAITQLRIQFVQSFTAFLSRRCFRLLAEGCWAAVCPCWGASDEFKSEDVEGGEAERAEALFPGRVQHEERLPGQGHLRPVRMWISWSNNAAICHDVMMLCEKGWWCIPNGGYKEKLILCTLEFLESGNSTPWSFLDFTKYKARQNISIPN